MVFTTEGFFEVVVESWPEWDLNDKCCYSLNVGLNDFCYFCLDALSDILIQQLHTFKTLRKNIFD